MEPGFFQHQSQKQILSPQIRQYLKLLQLPLTELVQAVDTEMAENPMLEESDKAGDEPLAAPPETEPLKEPAEKELSFDDSFEYFDKLDESFQANYRESDLSGYSREELRKKHDFQESLLTKPETLFDFLNWQIRFLNLDGIEKKIAEEIVGNIDEEGYLKATAQEIATTTGQPPEKIEKVLAKIQDLDPPGIAARDLREALLIQLRKKPGNTKLAQKIVADYLILLEKREWQQLARILCVDSGEIKEAVAVIGQLEPRPGRTFYSEDPIAVTPDATVYFDEDDETKLKIEVHDESIPELRINPYYRRLMREKATDEKTRVFLREKMQNAVNFIKALQLRKSTLCEITEEIVRVQAAFFAKGFAEMVPLRLKDVAEQLGIHESTVSRAIHGKYISTPQGTIAYKSFFTNRMETTTGDVESQRSIMEKIRSLIDKENPAKPLSDQEIVTILQQQGMVIARRTVAKYRDLLKILPSHLRRKK